MGASRWNGELECMDIFFKEWWDSGREDPEEFASLVHQYADAVRMIEREACAKVCDEYAEGSRENMADICADKIRGRSDV